MTNVLLGAKRHKGEPDVAAVVELLTRYLRYPYGLQDVKPVPNRRSPTAHGGGCGPA